MGCTVQPSPLHSYARFLMWDWLFKWNKKAADAKSDIYKPKNPPQNISACLSDWSQRKKFCFLLFWRINHYHCDMLQCNNHNSAFIVRHPRGRSELRWKEDPEILILTTLWKEGKCSFVSLFTLYDLFNLKINSTLKCYFVPGNKIQVWKKRKRIVMQVRRQKVLHLKCWYKPWGVNRRLVQAHNHTTDCFLSH